MNKMLSADEAVGLIPDGATIWVVSSGGGINEPCLVLKHLEKRFMETGHPHSLAVCHSTGFGDHNGGGADRFAHPGMVRKVIGGHWAWSPGICRMADNNEIEAYTLPQGVMVQLVRAMAGGRPGILTHVGIGTFIDPRVEGCAMNQVSKEELVRVVPVNDEDYLFYQSISVNAAIIRGTTADEDGNIAMEHEGVSLEGLSAAQAARRHGGRVIAQVKRVVQNGTLKATQVKVPGILVDAVVVDPGQKQSFATHYNPAYTGQMRTVLTRTHHFELNERTVIARRAAQELWRGANINLGFGVPTGIARIALAEHVFDQVTLTVEQGVIGGVPAEDFDFSMAMNPKAIIDQGYQFDWYDGGGLDIAFLAFAEFDREGNVNVSRFGSRLTGTGPGGFINIAQNAKRVVFLGAFTTGGLRIGFADHAVQILQEGRQRKAVAKVNQICFSGAQAVKNAKQVLYVTERAVFELTAEGIRIREVAPGIDVARDILGCMDFAPIYDPATVRTMDMRVFSLDQLDLIGQPSFQIPSQTR